MIRVNVLYGGNDKGRFDFDYYTKSHLPMVSKLLTPFGLRGITADKGVAGFTPGAPPAYVCVASLEFTSAEEMQRGLAEHGPAIMGDIPNYTDLQPVIQVSEVLL